MLNFEEKREIAKYLIDAWDFSGNDSEELDLEIALDKAQEAYGNDRPIKWKNTPSIVAEEILYNHLQD